MKINQIIINEMTTAGAVATVAKPMGETQKRPDVKGLEPAEKVMSGKAKKKGPYANSISEAKKDFLSKLQKNVDKSNKQKKDTEEKIKQHQDDKKKVEEAKLDEDDVIIVPGTKMKRKTGFVQHGQSRVDHEVEMARSDVLATMKNAKSIYELLQNRSEEEGIEGWVQEKLIKANDYLNAVKEYYDEKMMQEMTGGVIAGGGVGEGVAESPEDRRQWSKKELEQLRMAGKEIFAMFPDEDKPNPEMQKFVKKQIKTKPMAGPKGNLPEGQVNEKAVSKAQQKFFGMAHAMQKGAKIKGASKELKDVAKSMTKGDVKDFAATKHKGLPEKVKKD